MNIIEETLINEYKDKANEIIDGLKENKVISFRVNTLKSNKEEIISFLNQNNIEYETYDFYDLAFSFKNLNLNGVKELSIYKEGKIYLQSLSSMIPPLYLDLDKALDLVDMCAAPGSKTSQISMMVNDKCHILALEKDNIRSQRLVHNLNLLNSKNVTVLNKSALELDDYLMFDTILLDAPCTGIGTIDLNDESSYKYYSNKLLVNTVRIQEKLLNKALKVLKKGHTMIYSTCSLNYEENEGILKKCLKKNNASIVDIKVADSFIPLLESDLKGVIKVKPNKYFEGFFIAKIIKN